MKIVNISLAAPYNEGWGYQENLLTKWQKRIGNDVTLITTRFESRKSDDHYNKVSAITYTNDDGVKIIRQEWLLDIWACRILHMYKNLYKTIEKEKPDFLFIHACQFLDAFKICKYLKNNPNVLAVCDNHADFTNSAKSLFPKLLHKTLWKITAKKLAKQVKMFYGVLPARCDFLHDVYGVDSKQIDLLFMGADNEVINESKSNINIIKERLNIDSHYINFVSGGKFDHYKKEIVNLMKAINNLDNVHLYIFGSIGDEIAVEFESLLSNKITYAGWLNQTDSYALIQACDFAFFPGRHSVIWEQCVALGIPVIVKNHKGTNHININNNCLFLDDISILNIQKTLSDIINNNKLSNSLKNNARSIVNNPFLYEEIAKKSIETYK